MAASVAAPTPSLQPTTPHSCMVVSGASAWSRACRNAQGDTLYYTYLARAYRGQGLATCNKIESGSTKTGNTQKLNLGRGEEGASAVCRSGMGILVSWGKGAIKWAELYRLCTPVGLVGGGREGGRAHIGSATGAPWPFAQTPDGRAGWARPAAGAPLHCCLRCLLHCAPLRRCSGMAGLAASGTLSITMEE